MPTRRGFLKGAMGLLVAAGAGELLIPEPKIYALGWPEGWVRDDVRAGPDRWLYKDAACIVRHMEDYAPPLPRGEMPVLTVPQHMWYGMADDWASYQVYGPYDAKMEPFGTRLTRIGDSDAPSPANWEIRPGSHLITSSHDLRPSAARAHPKRATAPLRDRRALPLDPL